MSLRDAIDIIRLRLPDGEQEKIAQALASASSESELTVPGFSIWRVRSFEGLKFTFEKRLIGCESTVKEQWLREELAFLNQSSAVGTTQDLWQGYFVTDSARTFFLVDVGRTSLCTGPYP